MTDSSDLYEYRLKTVDSSDGLFMLAALVISALFSTGLITVLIPSNLYNNMPVVVYAIICGLCTMFIWFGFIPFLPASNPERFYFGQRGFRFESSLYSSTASFYRPADKVRRILLGRDNVLELTDSLGNTFRLPKVRYSLQSERELAECFPHAMVWQSELETEIQIEERKHWITALDSYFADGTKFIRLFRALALFGILFVLADAALGRQFDLQKLAAVSVPIFFLWWLE